MGRGISRFKKRDLQAALRAAHDAGVQIGTIEVKPDGSLVLKAGKPDSANPSGNSWDEVLNASEVEAHPKIRR